MALAWTSRMALSVRWRWLVIVLGLVAFVMIPFVLFEEDVNQWVASALRSDLSPGLAAVFVTMLLAADVVLPVPSIGVSVFAGYALGFWNGLFWSAAGLTLGCVAGYGLGRSGGRAITRRTVGDQQMDEVARHLWRRGLWAIVLLRPVPVLAEASVISAGAMAVPFGQFFVLSTASNIAISVIYSAVGAFGLRGPALTFACALALTVVVLAMRAWLRRS